MDALQAAKETYTDRGAAAIGLTQSVDPLRGHQIVLSFLVLVKWIGIPAELAIECANRLAESAESMPEPVRGDNFGWGEAPISVAADAEHYAIVLTMRVPAHTVTIGRYGALWLADEIREAAQQLPSKEQST